MINILSYLPLKRKQAPSGWISFNAICCQHNGERPDTRGRGGLLQSADGSFRYHCFNCSFSTGYTVGQPLSKKARQLLSWLGVDPAIVRKLSLDNLKHKGSNNGYSSTSAITAKFNAATLPESAVPLDASNAAHDKFVEYLNSRRLPLDGYEFYVSPDAPGRHRNRIIIPFTYDGSIVGHTARYIDGQQPKYINSFQTGYAFNVDRQSSKWQYIFVVEGVLDAMAIDGIGLLHNDCNQLQTDIINNLHKQVVVIPDREKAGETLIKRAVQNGWAVSFPEWDDDVKDVADAVARYGKLITMISVVESIETSRLKIELKRKQYAKRLQR